MERVNRILLHAEYQKNRERIEQCEADRIFCKHDIGHFLDVARIAQILNLKEELHISEELIYAAGLLHDIGRHIQYMDGTPHEKASVPIAAGILETCGFDNMETELILYAIENHRTSKIKENKDLAGVIYRADKLSRPCFSCQMEPECNWKNDKKNRNIVQ